MRAADLAAASIPGLEGRGSYSSSLVFRVIPHLAARLDPSLLPRLKPNQRYGYEDASHPPSYAPGLRGGELRDLVISVVSNADLFYGVPAGSPLRDETRLRMLCEDTGSGRNPVIMALDRIAPDPSPARRRGPPLPPLTGVFLVAETRSGSQRTLSYHDDRGSAEAALERAASGELTERMRRIAPFAVAPGEDPSGAVVALTLRTPEDDVLSGPVPCRVGGDEPVVPDEPLDDDPSP
ncbi:MAG: hypothetical protein DI629_20345 [Mesorhizobium amorphae]|nr:MAG: hypothetical protein DI629_20345 [Mesorhizobium amorphae]